MTTLNKSTNQNLHTTVQNYYDGKLLMEMEKQLIGLWMQLLIILTRNIIKNQLILTKKAPFLWSFFNSLFIKVVFKFFSKFTTSIKKN